MKILKKGEEHTPELTTLLEKQRTLTQMKVSVISNATDVINCLSSQYEHSIAAIKVAIERELVSDSSCEKTMIIILHTDESKKLSSRKLQEE